MQPPDTSAPDTSTTTTTITTTTEAPRGMRVEAVPRGLAITPGGQAAVVGGGCDPLAAVTLSVAGADARTGQADSQGNFRIDLGHLNLDAGRHMVTAACGPAPAAAFIDVAVQTASTGTPGHTAALLLIIIFVVACVAVALRMAR